MQWKPILLLVSSTFFGITNSLPSTPVATVLPQAQIVEQVASNTVSKLPKEERKTGNAVLLPELVPICACESTGRIDGTPTQFEKDGVTVKRGRINHDDIGMCQINIEPRNGHLEASKKLGFDVFTEEGNIKYANHLYQQSGAAPWEWSASCWRK